MNLSHAYSGHAPKPKSYVGIGLVVAVHVAAIYALSAGLIKSPPEPPKIITLKPLPPEVQPDPPKPEPRPVDRPVLRDFQPIPVPVPDDVVVTQDPPPVGPTVIRDTGTLVAERGPARADPTPAQPASKPRLQTPGAVCSVMPKPEMPALNWSGEAVLNVVATVRGGRVVGTDFHVTQGALDGKTRRSLQRSVETALAGYQCQGDAMFQQDFAFSID